MKHPMTQRGFTIVELLIVIVVIGVLAAITIVAFNGIQRRAQVAEINSDLASINKAIRMHYSEFGTYPDTSNAWRGYRTFGAHGQSFVPNVSSYISTLPDPAPLSATSDYLYRSNGTEYKLMAHNNSAANDGFMTLCPTAVQQNPSMADTSRNCWAWGYWSPGGSSL
jgi:prepilin-type N-terminal cleavage/methylation domain-containing protein